MAAPTFIAKVQLSLTTTEAKRQVLIIDEYGLWWQGEAPPEVLKAMGEETKAFFRVRRTADTIELVERAPWQEW